MAHVGRQKADQALLVALACGATAENAARAAGVSVRTVNRRFKDPEFRRQLQGIRDDMVERASGMLTAAAMEAVKTMLSLQGSAPPAVRLGAARSLLEFGLKFREFGDLAERIAALEATVNGTADPSAGAA